jgi:hypothetical protein
MMTIGQMGENNELIALKASGVSVFRVMAPILVASVLISIGTFYIINKVVPVSYNQIFTLRDDIGKTKDEIKIPRGTFYDGVEGFVLRIDDMDDRSGMMHGVMLYDHSGHGNTRLTLAASALMPVAVWLLGGAPWQVALAVFVGVMIFVPENLNALATMPWSMVSPRARRSTSVQRTPSHLPSVTSCRRRCIMGRAAMVSPETISRYTASGGT